MTMNIRNFLRPVGAPVMRGSGGKAALVLIAVAVVCVASWGQTQRQNPTPSSDLGRENLSRVAASATEIKAVLLKDTGLLVELKRWVAKDATDHGQNLREGL